jgi:hypothetical protein
MPHSAAEAVASSSEGTSFLCPTPTIRFGHSTLKLATRLVPDAVPEGVDSITQLREVTREPIVAEVENVTAAQCYPVTCQWSEEELLCCPKTLQEQAPSVDQLLHSLSATIRLPPMW